MKGIDGMSVLIKNMDMPKSCEFCRFISSSTNDCEPNWKCEVGNFLFSDYNKIQSNCPLIDIPSYRYNELIDGSYPFFPTSFRYNDTDYAKGWNDCIKAVNHYKLKDII